MCPVFIHAGLIGVGNDDRQACAGERMEMLCTS